MPTQPNNHVSVFPYPGGKGRGVDWILEKMPPHDTFVDVFGGSGAIIYNKPPSTNEVYNDANEDLVQFFQVLREHEDDLLEWIDEGDIDRSDCVDLPRTVEAADTIERTANTLHKTADVLRTELETEDEH